MALAAGGRKRHSIWRPPLRAWATLRTAVQESKRLGSGDLSECGDFYQAAVLINLSHGVMPWIEAPHHRTFGGPDRFAKTLPQRDWVARMTACFRSNARRATQIHRQTPPLPVEVQNPLAARVRLERRCSEKWTARNLDCRAISGSRKFEPLKFVQFARRAGFRPKTRESSLRVKTKSVSSITPVHRLRFVQLIQFANDRRNLPK